jgi:hypothetical protein
MMRHTKALPFLLILAFTPLLSCSKDNPTSPPADPRPDCEYSLPENRPSIAAAEVPDLLGVPFEQEKLTTLMSLNADQDTCFIRYQGKIEIFKISDSFAALSVGQQNLEDPLFTALNPAPEELIPDWKALEERFHLPLMGVTFLRFFDQPERREIVDARIVMNTRARPWHMWHEFGHFLIAQTRDRRIDQHLAAPSMEDIDAAKKDLYTSLETENEVAQITAFTHLVDVYSRFDQRLYLEEMAIELALLHYTSQYTEKTVNERIAPQDPQESFRTVDFFFQTHVNWYKKFFHEFRSILKHHENLKGPLADMEKSLIEKDHRLREFIHTTRENFLVEP